MIFRTLYHRNPVPAAHAKPTRFRWARVYRYLMLCVFLSGEFQVTLQKLQA